VLVPFFLKKGFINLGIGGIKPFSTTTIDLTVKAIVRDVTLLSKCVFFTAKGVLALYVHMLFDKEKGGSTYQRMFWRICGSITFRTNK
jgi:hypothetical protein